MTALFLIVFIDLIGFGVIIPLLPFYAEHFKASPDIVTLVMATYSFTQFFAAPLWGRLSDRIGRRPVLLFSLAGASASYVWLGFADSLAMLFAARAFGGAMAGNISAAFAYIADITGPEDRAKGMGIIGAAFGLGFIAGPALGGVLAGPDPINANFQSPAFAAAGLSLLALVLAVFRLRESLPPETRTQMAAMTGAQRRRILLENLRNPTLAVLIGLSFLSTFVFAGMETTFALWSERTFGWGPQQNGYVFAGVGTVGVIIQGAFMGRLARRFGEGRLVVQGTAALALGLALLPFSAHPLTLTFVMILLAYGFSVITPALNSLISFHVGSGNQGTIMGFVRSSTILARVVGPACAGVVFATWGKDVPYFSGALLMLGIFCFALFSAALSRR